MSSANSRKPTPSPSRLTAAPLLFCLFCAQLMKAGKQENLMPAITLVPINMDGVNWQTVPVCMGHLETPKGSNLIV